jgi:hypothetical protein
MNEESSTPTFDVYISYSDVDKGWVRSTLIPRLTEAGLTVCTKHASFAIGVPRLVNIEWAVVSSRYTLLVLTPAWLNSELETFAGLLARSEDPVGRRRSTIPLLVEPCSPPRAIARLHSADLTDSRNSAQQWDHLIETLHGQRQRSAIGPPLGSVLGLEKLTNVLYRPNPYFVGREEELATLHNVLSSLEFTEVSTGIPAARTSTRIVGLVGLGGVGKTQLAVEYILSVWRRLPWRHLLDQRSRVTCRWFCEDRSPHQREQP